MKWYLGLKDRILAKHLGLLLSKQVVTAFTVFIPCAQKEKKNISKKDTSNLHTNLHTLLTYNPKLKSNSFVSRNFIKILLVAMFAKDRQWMSSTQSHEEYCLTSSHGLHLSIDQRP